jgi:hypothetical protein
VRFGLAMLGGRLIDMIAACFGEEYVAEIRSIAKHAGQPLSHVVLGNFMYDGCQMAGIHGLGCSSYSCNIDGKPTLVRNMDWVWPRSTGRQSRLIRFHRGRDAYTSVSVLGCVGVVSAFCPGKSGRDDRRPGISSGQCSSDSGTCATSWARTAMS